MVVRMVGGYVGGVVLRVHGTFPNMEGEAVLNVKTALKYGKKSGKNRDCW